MRQCVIAFLFVKSSQSLIKSKCFRKLPYHSFHSVGKLAAVIVDLHHFLYAFQPDNVSVGKPAGLQDLVRLLFFINAAVIPGFLIHIGSLQHFQETKLELLGRQGVYLVKRSGKTAVVFPGKAGDQIQVLVDISALINCPDPGGDLLKGSISADLFQSLLIGRLDADLQLDQSRTHGPDQGDFLLCEKICTDLKVEVGHSIVMILDIPPDFQRMVLPAVKGSVHKFYLGYFCLQKNIQLLFYQIQAFKPELFIHRRQTIAAGKGAAPAALVIKDLVRKGRKILIGEYQPVHVQDIRKSGIYCSLISPKTDPGDLIQSLFLF